MASYRENIIEAFFVCFEEALCQMTTWCGHKVNKSPFDLFVYQRIIHKTRPTVIIECGTNRGGSAVFFRDVLRSCGIDGKVVTIEVTGRVSQTVDGVYYLKGNSVDSEVVEVVKRLVKDTDKVMVSLDSAHNKRHVLNEIHTYAPMVTSGMYMVVEDTAVNGHPIKPYYGDGPWEAVEEFFKEDTPLSRSFVADKSVEVFPFTYNPYGWLYKS